MYFIKSKKKKKYKLQSMTKTSMFIVKYIFVQKKLELDTP